MGRPVNDANPADALTAALVAAEAACEANAWSFPDLLRECLEGVALELGGVEALVRTRPGSWEADHLRALAAMADPFP
jgi:hypothetical protein